MVFVSLYLLPIIPMVPMIVSDFSIRKICVVWLILFIICISILAVTVNGFEQCLRNILSNVVLLTYLAAGVILYLKIKTRRWVNPLNKYIGSGDLWLFIGLTPLFSLKGYMLFALTSFLLSLVWWSIVAIFRRVKSDVPLVGIVGVVFCIWVIFNTTSL